MKRRRYWRAVLPPAALLFAALLFALYSETALRWGVALLSDVVEPLEVTAVQGRLAGPMTLSGIEYKDTALTLSLAQLRLDWKPLSLLNGTAHITTVAAKGVDIKLHPAAPAKRTADAPLTALPPIELPLKLIIDHAALDAISLSPPEPSAPLTIKQLALAAQMHRHTLTLHALTMESDWLTFALNGTIKPIGDYDLDLKMSWRVPQPPASPWQGEGRLHGNLKGVTLQQQLTAPFTASLTLRAKALLEALAWEGTLTVPQLASSRLPIPISPAFTMGATVEASGGIDTASATVSFAGDVENVGAIEGNINAEYKNRLLTLTKLLISKTGNPAQLQANGDIALSGPLPYRLNVTWQALGWPLSQPGIHSRSGSLSIAGDTEQYRFDGGFLLDGAQVPKSEWRLQGDGNRDAVAIERLDGKLLDGSVSANLTLTLTPSLSWQGTLQGRELDPGVQWPQWPGRIAMESAITGRLSEAGPVVDVDLTSLSGTLRGREVTAHSRAEWRNRAASIDSLDLRIGSAQLQAHGSLGEESAFEWRLAADELADLLPQATGSLKADGRLTGPRRAPKAALRMNGDKLGYAGFAAERLSADLELDLQPDRPSRAALGFEALAVPGMPSQSLTLNMQGPLKAHRLTLESQSVQQRLNLALEAGYNGQQWSGSLLRLQIDDEQLGPWRLAKSMGFSVQSSALHIDEFCLNNNEATLCTGAEWRDGDGLSAALRSTRFPLQLLAPYLPRRFGIETELSGKLNIAVAPERPPRIDADLTLGEGRLRLLDPESETELLTLPFQGVDVRFDTTGEGDIAGAMTLRLIRSDTVSLTLKSSLAHGIPDSFAQQPLSARLRVSVQELGVLSGLLPELQQVEGKIDADVSLTGSFAAPRLKGFAALENGRFEIPRAGLSLSAVSLKATGDNTRRMRINGSAHSGDGDLSVTGQLVPQPKGVWALELALSAERFTVADIPEARVQVSPDLKIRIVGREIHLEGDLDIPEARLEPRDLSVAVAPSEDVEIVGEAPATAEQERWLIYTRIRMSAADSIHFIGYGFDGRIGGELLLIDEPGSLTRARGVLSVVPGSSYKAFSKKLTIEHGRLNFADSLVDDPNLDIRASRTIGDVVAGVNVRGTAQKPLLTLFSEPPMDQADILSYLTLGHPVSSANRNEGEVLAGAAGSAGLVGGNYLAGYISRQFGLEEARVEASQATQSPWLVVGKYLSPRLYIRYGVGVYEDAYSVMLRYQLSKHWQLQGEGGLNSGADIIYTFERP